MLRPFSRFCIMIGAIPESIIHSLSYEQQLLRLIKFLKNTVIPAIDGNTTAIKAIEEWIENVDLQEFVDNKLDEMVESGELQEIISEYLNSQAIFGFNTVADMIASENLINGSYAKTLGYYSINDGGEATYKIRTITNEDVIDNGSIIAMNDETLVAELIDNGTLNVEQFGIASSQNATTNTTQLIKLIEYSSGGKILKFNDEYEINHIEFDNELTNIEFIGINGKAKLIKSASIDDYLFEFNNHTQKLVFKDLYIECNGSGGGLKFVNYNSSSEGVHSYNRFENVDIRHANKGLSLNAVVYFHINNCNISLSGNLASDDFGIELNGYEYNYFKDTSVQFWVDNITDAPDDICAIKGEGVHVAYFDNIEIVKCNGYGYKFTTDNKSCSFIRINNNTIYNVNKPINFDIKNYSISDVTISNNQITNEGSNKNIVFTNSSGTTKLCVGMNIINNVVNKNNIISIDDNLSNLIHKWNIKGNIRTTSAGYSDYDINNNYVSLSSPNLQTEYTEQFTPSSTSLSYRDVVVAYNKIPKMPDTNMPYVIANTSIPVHYINITKEDSDSRYRIRFYFDDYTFSTSTQYTIRYFVITE